LALDVSFSGRVQMATPVISRMTDNAMVQTWRLSTIEPLAGQEVRIDGLASTMTDALVRIEFIDGGEWVERLTPGTPRATIPARQGGWAVATTYLKLGVEHIMLGVDHLLFVLALILIAPNTRQLVMAITAFTVAHSITLAAATLGFVNVPPPPVEAAIALSIAFVASEIIRAREGKVGIAARAPACSSIILSTSLAVGLEGLWIRSDEGSAALTADGKPDHIVTAVVVLDEGPDDDGQSALRGLHLGSVQGGCDLQDLHRRHGRRGHKGA